MTVGLSINDSAVLIVALCLLVSKSNCMHLYAHYFTFVVPVETMKCVKMLEYNFCCTTFVYTTVQKLFFYF